MKMPLKERLKELERERAQKNYAHGQVSNAIKAGRLQKEPCACGEIKVEAHHADYNRPLDVIWACKKHHVELDRMKRNSDLLEQTGIILD